MADLETALNYVLGWEDPKLTGKVTIDNNGSPVRFGINKKFHQDLDPRFWDEKQMGTTEALALARTVYQQEYWRPVKGDNIQNQDVANKLLDMAVNEGVKTAIKAIQRVATVWGKQIVVDGKFGLQTLAAVNGLNIQQALIGMRKEWELRWDNILEVHPEWEPLRAGLMKRVNA